MTAQPTVVVYCDGTTKSPHPATPISAYWREHRGWIPVESATFDGAPFTASNAQVEYLLPTAPPSGAFTTMLKAFEVARGHLPIVRTRHIPPEGVDRDWHSFNHRWRCTHPGCDFDLTADADGTAVDRLFDTFADQGKVSIACIDAIQKKAAKRRGHKRR